MQSRKDADREGSGGEPAFRTRTGYVAYVSLTNQLYK